MYYPAQRKPFTVFYHRKPCKGVAETMNCQDWLCTSCGAEGHFWSLGDEIFEMVIPTWFVRNPDDILQA
ncbi:MAG: hypothetical protein Greene071421_247 [Parcubacteria group bacterium Greene0714_21]|nr:MAG: hypothetical protein Greene041639_287 [Parcubacteria group bacterium Greene0416_39]TSD04411.1 MAG: hypothetical protein Greene071421_247 [Parcubacteria group bacterium Greene0714_21]